MANVPLRLKLPPKFDERLFHDTILQVRDTLRRIAESSPVAEDAEAQRLMIEFTHCRDMLEVDTHMDRFMTRVFELLAAKTGNDAILHDLLSGSRRTSARVKARLAQAQQPTIGNEPRAFTRMIVKL